MSDNNGKPARIIPIRDRQDPRGPGTKYATKDEMVAGMAAGSLAMGQKVYDQVVARTSELLAEMEHRLQQDFDAKLAQLRADAGL